MANTSCLLGTYYYRGTATLPDDYDYKDSIERSKKKFQMNILSTDVLVNIKDIKLCTEKLVRRSITLCVEMEKDFREHYRKGYIKDKHINDNHTRKEILEDIFIPFFFNRIECKTKQFDRRHDNFTDISWFPTKKTQVREIAKRHTRLKTVDSEFHYYTKEIMETYYPEIYQFYEDMTKWERIAMIIDGIKNYCDLGVKRITKENREKYSLIREPNESSFDFLVRIIGILDNLDPYPDHPILINFFSRFQGFFATVYCDV